MSSALQIGTTALLALSAGVMLYVAGKLNVRDAVNFASQNGTQSGAVIQVEGVTEIQAYTIPCTATGGNVKVGAGAAAGAKYDTCIIPPLLSSTGAIKEISLHVVNSPFVVGVDCSYVKDRVSGTGSAFIGTSNITTATGGIFRVFGSGAVTSRWNSADFIKCGTLADPTSSFSAKLRVEFYDDQSE